MVRRSLRLVATTTLVLASIATTGCVTVVTPPAELERPITVYILHYEGNHNSLLLPSTEGLTEYSFGDWDWYAKSRGTLWAAVKSMALPSKGALGRRTVDLNYLAPGDPARELKSNPRFRSFTQLVVDSKRAQTLLQNLNTLYAAHEETELYNERVDLHFVEHPATYAVWNTCNHELSGWIKQLDCDVDSCSVGYFAVNAN